MKKNNTQKKRIKKELEEVMETNQIKSNKAGGIGKLNERGKG